MQTDKMKVLLYLKKSGLDKSGLAPIMGRITYGRTMAQFSCKLSCVPKLWNARESRLNGKSREAVTTNGRLERLLLSAQSAYQTLCERGIVFTATDIKELLQGSMQSQITFLERYDQMLEEMKQKEGIEIKATAVKDFLFLTRKIDIENNIVNDPFCKGPLTIPSLGDLCTEVSVSFE